MLLICLQPHTPHTLHRATSSCTLVMDLNIASPMPPPTLKPNYSSSVCSSSLSVSSSPLKKQLDRLNQNNSAGTDGVNPSVLKPCAEQLCGIQQHLFNLTQESGESSRAMEDILPCSCIFFWYMQKRLLLTHLNKQLNTFQDQL